MSNVVFDRHSVESVGDISHIGNIKSSSNGKTSGDDFVNSKEYHFHSTIQHIEDGLIEQWKEQNKNMNQNRETVVSSLTDAKFRKLGTTMVFPIFYNLGSLILLLSIVPLFFAFKSESNLMASIGTILGIGLFFNILFDAFIIYRVRKYVIESVTNRYYAIIKRAWRSFEIFSFLIGIVLVYLILFHFNTGINLNVKILNKLFSHFDISTYKIMFALILITTFAIYSITMFMLFKKSIIEQRQSLIESRSGSEHNVDVAEKILNGTLDDFDN